MENEIKYINRELSWLDFNYRVLQEAIDKKNPILERFKYLGIFSNNKDEFFRVRVATINRMRIHKKVTDAVKKSLTNTFLELQQKVAHQEEIYNETYHSLIAEARENNVFLIDENEINESQKEYISQYFDEEVRKHVFPLMLGDNQKYKNFKDKTVYLAIEMKDSKKILKDRYALIEMPTNILSRFVKLPTVGDKKYIMFLDDVVRFNLHAIFSILGYDIFVAHMVKLTREAELDIDNDVLKSFLELMSDSVKKRKKAPPIRFVYDRSISPKLLKVVLNTFGIKSNDNLRAGGRYHNLKDFMDFPSLDPELFYKPIQPFIHPELPANKSKFDILRRKDILLHYPYHSFKSTISLIWEAAVDPNVRAIKMTFYRVSRNSSLMKGLINAARNGKAVTVFMELQARFDEEDNIYWAERLQEEGVKIIPTIPGFKVHCKLILIRRKEAGANVYYSNVSTGNFHEATARVYSDTSLMTSNHDICKDVNNVFQLFETKFNRPTFKALKVAPFKIRDFIYKRIEIETHNALEGKEAFCIIKINNLVDMGIIKKIYKAADAGVKFKLIIRGICVLRENFTHENIEAIGVVDRYLEHSRIFIFANGGDRKYYISSADLMSRNLDHRVEVVCPIHSPEHQKEIQDLIDIQLQDNMKARNLQGRDINKYLIPQDGILHQSQLETYKYLKAKEEK
ncbi:MULTISPECIES: polyphosphate kinase 1 [unclassified Lentimicrobium]|uniref:polyphosphate kinase 1 n=1 Tax=unclassified Lentimicrobium TaxID=2677434 RepID=UPI00155707A5|nr:MULTISPECIES: polyphosphate kinase 1 [unclassified Lentimicrobium]NPD44498.1 polyphosphate kinase 1 [Lentimicrobium sp. S6]NPD84202.1 polyphosphate kinase 1 [Lentimicrobium sp. L6]